MQLYQDSAAAFQTKLDQLIAAMDADKERGDLFMENVKLLRNAASRDLRCQDMKECYKRTAMADSLKSFGAKLAKTLSTFINEEQNNPMPEAGDVSHQQALTIRRPCCSLARMGLQEDWSTVSSMTTKTILRRRSRASSKR